MDKVRLLSPYTVSATFFSLRSDHMIGEWCEKFNCSLSLCSVLLSAFVRHCGTFHLTVVDDVHARFFSSIHHCTPDQGPENFLIPSQTGNIRRTAVTEVENGFEPYHIIPSR